jgi:thiol:disulfide interchange protein
MRRMGGLTNCARASSSHTRFFRGGIHSLFKTVRSQNRPALDWLVAKFGPALLMNKMLFLPVFAMAALPLIAVEVGHSLENVVAEKGPAPSKMQMGDMLVLNYPDETVRLRDGKVIAVKAIKGSGSAVAVSAPALPPGQWTTDYEKALVAAKAENRHVLLFFTGSDWCGWCQRLDSEILSTADFREFASKRLILVKLDFPRNSPQAAGLQAQNDRLAKIHSIQGFPTMVFLNSAGKRVAEFGYEEGGPAPFLKKLKKL